MANVIEGGRPVGMIGRMGLIDCHVHVYPEEIGADPQGWAASHGEHRWAVMVAPRLDGRTIQGWASPAQMIRDMDSAGIEKSILQGWYWENPESCVLHNRFMKACIEEHPDRLAASASFHAGGGDAALDDLRRAREAGFVGLGELCPPAQGYEHEDPVFERALALAAELKWPVTLHVTEPAGRTYPGRVETPLNRIVELVGRHPDVRFVLAHWGGMLPFFEMNSAVRKALSNAYYDTAASPLIYGGGITAAVLAAVGPRRVLYGSDYPILSRGQTAPAFEPFLNVVTSSGIDREAVSAITELNARRLYDLTGERTQKRRPEMGAF